MIVPFATAMALQCFFNQPSDGSVPKDSLPAMRVPLPAAFEASLAAHQPPVNTTAFAGEASPSREWVLGRPLNPDNTEAMILRVRLAEGSYPSMPFSARYGNVAKRENGTYKFTPALTGACKLQPANGTPE